MQLVNVENEPEHMKIGKLCRDFWSMEQTIKIAFNNFTPKTCNWKMVIVLHFPQHWIVNMHTYIKFKWNAIFGKMGKVSNYTAVMSSLIKCQPTSVILCHRLKSKCLQLKSKKQCCDAFTPSCFLSRFLVAFNYHIFFYFLFGCFFLFCNISLFPWFYIVLRRPIIVRNTEIWYHCHKIVFRKFYGLYSSNHVVGISFKLILSDIWPFQIEFNVISHAEILVFQHYLLLAIFKIHIHRWKRANIDWH